MESVEGSVEGRRILPLHDDELELAALEDEEMSLDALLLASDALDDADPESEPDPEPELTLGGPAGALVAT